MIAVGAEQKSEVGRRLTSAPPGGRLGSGPEREGSSLLLRLRVWSGGNGQKGEKEPLPVAWHKMNYRRLSAPVPHSESRVWRAR